MIKFDVLSRWTGRVQFTAEIDCSEDTLPSIKLGLAVKWAYRTGARLDGASLVGARLDGASLDDKTMRPFKADYWMILAGAIGEVPGLIKALREGRVDGSTYHGECACLVGTIANVRHVKVDTLLMDSSRPAEQWFLMIRKGDLPEHKTGGGFAAAKALEWALEWCALVGIDPEAVSAPVPAPKARSRKAAA